MVLAIAPMQNEAYLVDTATITPIWAVADSFRREEQLTLPLVRHPGPCEYADRMRVGTLAEGFPPLAPMRIGLFYKHARLSKAAHGLAQWLMQQITLAGQDLPA